MPQIVINEEGSGVWTSERGIWGSFFSLDFSLEGRQGHLGSVYLSYTDDPLHYSLSGYGNSPLGSSQITTKISKVQNKIYSYGICMGSLGGNNK